jgi:hypothetical protein
MSKGWKFGLLKVAEEDGDDVCELVELYPLGSNGEYDSFCKAHIGSTQCLKNALRDTERDGTNYEFWNSGKFTWNTTEYWWDWEKNI